MGYLKRCDRCGHTRDQHQEHNPAERYVNSPCLMDECPCADWSYNILKDIPGPDVKYDASAMNRTRDFFEAQGIDPYAEPIEKTRTALFKKADELVNGSREETYGPPEINFQTIADLWTAMGFRIESWDGKLRNINATDVALGMTQVKMGRLRTSPDHVDTWVDGIGYLGLGGEVANGDRVLPWNDYPVEVSPEEGYFGITFEHIAIPGQGDASSVHYFWRCGACYTYMEESNFAFHAWDTHQTRNWVVQDEVINQIPAKKFVKRITFSEVSRKGFGRNKKLIVRCDGCQDTLSWVFIQSHMEQVHPEVTVYLAPPGPTTVVMAT